MLPRFRTRVAVRPRRPCENCSRGRVGAWLYLRTASTTSRRVIYDRQRIRLMKLLIPALILITAPVLAAPPPNADPAFYGWFQSLQIPGTGIGCCSVADCRPVKYRQVGDRYEIMPMREQFPYLPDNVIGQWAPVPPAAILNNQSNPTGSAIACLQDLNGTLHIMCFIRETEG